MKFFIALFHSVFIIEISNIYFFTIIRANIMEFTKTHMVLLILAVSTSIFLFCTISKRKHSLDHPNLRRFNDHEINNIIITAWEQVSMKNYESAALDFERLIKKDYIDDDILFGAAISHYFTRKKTKALEFCTAALEKNPQHFEALFLRAQIYNDLGNTNAARTDFKKLATMEFHKDLICGYYFFDNDIANKQIFESRKRAAFEALNL
ncbi:MAG: tetratricopeptide repeat protein [Spirochaetes bacterium]|nr:tetratricopeptide repeat protein [Spirochaetota bacterium]